MMNSIKQIINNHTPPLEPEVCQYIESIIESSIKDGEVDSESVIDVVSNFLSNDETKQIVLLLMQTEISSDDNIVTGERTAISMSSQIMYDECQQQQHQEEEQQQQEGEKSSNKLTPDERKERRRQKKLQQKQNKKLPKLQEEEGGGEEDTNAIVSRINAQSAQAIQEIDDYGSAWADVKEQGKQWGGRGHGGRGISQAVYKGRNAVVNGLTLSYGGGRDLLLETHLAISHGHRYGLMGPNGCGKSTLLKRIASRNVPGWPLHLSVRMVEQEVLGTPQTVVECMKNEIDASNSNGASRRGSGTDFLKVELEELEALLEDANAQEPEELEAAYNRVSEIYDQLEAKEQQQESDNYDDNNDSSSSPSFGGLDKRAKTILKGLQFKESMLNVPGNVLSGGWRMRLALAKALYAEPDILLLDEPTNHLDVSAVMFLEDWIVDNDLTVVVVSHDGYFLDGICTDMIKFESLKLKYHVGNYSSFCEREQQTWTRNTKKADAASKKEKKTMEFINKQKSMANSKHRDDNKQKQAAERQRKLGRIGLFSENGQKYKLLAEGNTKRGGANRSQHIFGNYTNCRGMTSAFVSNEQVAFGEDRQLLNFRFPSAEPLKGGGGHLISMEGCRFRYPNAEPDSTWLLQDMSLNVSNGSRIAIVGKNGAGKSTLLKLMSGELQVSKGEFHRHSNLKIAHITQHHIEHLSSFLECTPVEYFLHKHGAKNEQEARQFLGGFGISGPISLQLIGTLSGGQKARLAFATVMYNAPHCLIMDEPTNHLDRDSLESLVAAVEKFEGAVVIVSHNQDFMSRCAKEMWTVQNGKVNVDVPDGEVTSFDDLYEQYKHGLRKELRRQR